MARFATAVAFAVLLIFTTVAFGGQQAPAQQITLIIAPVTITVDQLSYDSDSGVVKASGNVLVEVKGLQKLSTPDRVEVKIDRTRKTVEGQLFGRVSGEMTAQDGSVRTVNTAARPEGRAAFKFQYKF